MRAEPCSPRHSTILATLFAFAFSSQEKERLKADGGVWFTAGKRGVGHAAQEVFATAESAESGNRASAIREFADSLRTFDHKGGGAGG